MAGPGAIIQEDCKRRQGKYFKPKSDGKSSYEIFIPRQFTNDHPWGEKDEPISIQDSIRIRREKYQNPLEGADDLQDHPEVQIPYSFCFKMKLRVMHITHYNEAAKIISAKKGFDTFEAQKKVWENNEYSFTSADSGPLCSDSYYKLFTDDTLPGYFSWWSLDLQGTLPQHKEHQKLTKEAGGYTINPEPTYLFQSEQKSNYGNVKFSAELQVVVDAYKTSLEAKESKLEILFKKAGTLRYKYEIAYVIIVCAKIGVDPFPDYETLNPGDDCWLFITKPYQEITYSKFKHVKKRKFFQWNHSYSTSYDHYILAFHYQKEAAHRSFKIKKDKGSICNVIHDNSTLCHRLTKEKKKLVKGDECHEQTACTKQKKEVDAEMKSRSSTTGNPSVNEVTKSLGQMQLMN